MNFFTTSKTTDQSQNDQKDVKTDVPNKALPLSAMQRTKQIMRASKTGKKANKKPISVHLFSTLSNNAGANTVNSYTPGVSPVVAQDYAGFAGLYDECRCTHVKVYGTLSTLGTFAGTPTLGASALWGFAWDPINAGAYGGLADVCTAVHHHGPIAIPVATTAGTQAGVQVQPKDGVYVLNVKLHSDPLYTTITTGAIGGGWFGTNTASITIGYLKSYVSALGAATSSNITFFVDMTCEFRDRT